MAVLLPGALAVDLNVDVGFYFKQSRGGTCTLASAAMMLRRRAYLDGMDSWVDVTENGIKSTAWSGGLSHSFTYNDMHVGYATLPRQGGQDGSAGLHSGRASGGHCAVRPHQTPCPCS